MESAGDKTIELPPFEHAVASGLKKRFRFAGWSIPTGTVALLSGPNGAGKTTFLHRLKRELSHPCGTTRVFLLPQQFHDIVFPFKRVWWNISLPLVITRGLGRRDSRERAQKALDELNIEIDINRYPGSLSGGETHLMLIARMFLSDARLLLLDEPTAGLDSDRLLAFWKALTRVTTGSRAAILATHELVSGRPRLRSGPQSNQLSFSGIDGRSMSLSLSSGEISQ